MRGYIGIVFSLLFMAGCSGNDEPAGKIVLPSNMVVNIDVAQDGSGKVSVNASADNANFFTVTFGASGSGNSVTTNDGTASFTYTTSGTYTITVQAHTTTAAFISQTKEVTVSINPGEEPLPDYIPATGYTTPESYEGMTLVWQDEFEGTALNEDDWTYETGGHGWGNNELQYYRRENTSIVDGHLVITAKKENFEDREYTSSRLITMGKKEFQYGRIDIRAALPKGKGIWPALWMLGSNFPTDNWPKSGEIDIMELVGGPGGDNTSHGTLHWDNNGAPVCTCNEPSSYSLSEGKIFADEFHVFTIIWDEDAITWYVDDNQFLTISITPEGLSEFHNEFFFIFNVAVGGNWPGSPDGNTVFPQRMVVDYVRVFQEQ